MYGESRSWLLIAAHPDDSVVSDNLRFLNIGFDSDVIVATPLMPMVDDPTEVNFQSENLFDSTYGLIATLYNFYLISCTNLAGFSFQNEYFVRQKNLWTLVNTHNQYIRLIIMRKTIRKNERHASRIIEEN